MDGAEGMIEVPVLDEIGVGIEDGSGERDRDTRDTGRSW